MSIDMDKMADDIVNGFLDHVRFMIDYWDGIDNGYDQKERMYSLAFSILVAMDGGWSGSFDRISFSSECPKTGEEIKTSLDLNVMLHDLLYTEEMKINGDKS